MIFKLGSLFDGSGGFPLAGSLCGIEPRWASEIEPYPIAVTRERFPNMKHLGDISQINGAEVEPVDIITFGSPCQDLSVAGKRAGLKHESNGDEETTRSGLFMEAVRIIKEMRSATNGEYPRFALWENVPGAFSSNKGDDFRVVCEELIKIIEPSAVMPAVPKAGWAYADSFVGDGWSLAYRVFDAQYWGVPQRRRRIHLVVDFRGERAREILFERQGVRGYFTQSRETRQEIARNAERGVGADDRALRLMDAYQHHGWRENDLSLRAGAVPALVYAEKEYAAIPIHDQATRFSGKRGDKADGKGNGLGVGDPDAPMNTLTSADRHAVCYRQGGFADYVENEVGTLKASGGDLGGGSENLIVQKPKYIVRRLTPTECARLQGFADRWGYIEPKKDFSDDEYAFWTEVRMTHAIINGKEPKTYGRKQMLTWYNKLYTDSAEYKMWGNGIALPPALYCMQGLSDVLNEKASTESGEYLREDTVEKKTIVCMATQQGGAEIRCDDKAPTLTAAAGMSGNNQPVICYADTEPTDLSDAPKEIKAEILANAEKLEERETTEEEIMEQKNIEQQEIKTENTTADFCAAAQLRRLAEERKALANLRPNDTRFSDDIKALEYAINILETVGL